ncbi:pyridoxamine 5'-phosphate oxidase family protein [Roseovarius sp.]|uniref:pyridoxamine 5'-phosphate oxidase family protein n=1 Tax=Roseovarius sp. TaxID=1486281 RepID=UPI003A97FCF6
MTLQDGWTRDTSPFHAGELAVQERLGVREKMDGFGRKVVRPFMPEQHREFYAELPLIYVGHVDAEGRPWASVLVGGAGFITSPDPRTLTLDARPFAGDPLADGLAKGSFIGLLGINASNRRRNRVNGQITDRNGTEVTFTVDQSYGNCPQYIQTRTPFWTRDPKTPNDAAEVSRFTGLDSAARAMIAQANTFFVATASRNAGTDEGLNGADVSHRGGKPGFVRVEGNVVTIPDYPGNLHYNTLGNIEADPRAGLMFYDDQTGDVLMLTGTAEIDWDSTEAKAFRGAERLWSVKVTEAIRLPGALPLRWEFGGYSPNALMTGDWDETAANLAAEAKREVWRPYCVTAIKDESAVIRSFHLEAADGDGMFSYEPGQYLTIRVAPSGADQPLIRTYTLSSAPNDLTYRISIKREDARADGPAGRVSTHLHTTIKVGDIIEAKAPRGDFFLNTAEKRPAVLLAGGVGVTPMISMARQAASEGVRMRHTRPLRIFHAAQTTADRAFAEDFHALRAQTEGRIRYVSLINGPAADEVEGKDFDAQGYVTSDLLRKHLALDDYDFFVCGPPPFMQGVYNTLRGLGVRDARIFAEAFGPAALSRTPDEGAALKPDAAPEAEESVVAFKGSAFEQRWNKGDVPILELAEAHGLTPEYGCRNGTCGTCATKIMSGAVTYRGDVSAANAPDYALICCAVPATDRVELDL